MYMTQEHVKRRFYHKFSRTFCITKVGNMSTSGCLIPFFMQFDAKKCVCWVFLAENTFTLYY